MLRSRGVSLGHGACEAGVRDMYGVYKRKVRVTYRHGGCYWSNPL